MIDADLRLPHHPLLDAARSAVRWWAAIREADRRHTHATPLAILALANLIMLRHILFGSGLPAGVDSAFLYSELPYYAQHGLSVFTVWLPGPLGEVQQYSLYWALAAATAVTGHPLAVYKAAIAAVVATTTVGSYGFAFRTCGDRVGAACAALVYSFAPFAVAQWLDGHLNVQISYAVGPLALWALSDALRTGRARPAVALGACAAVLFLLTTGQGVYWVVPLALLTIRELTRGGRRGVARLGRTAAVAAVTFTALSALQLVPYLLGAKAPFVGGGGSYYIEQLSIHTKYSLPFLDGVAGAPRELYLPGTESVGWSAFAAWQLQLVGLAVAGVALAALATRRWRTALPFAAAATVAWLLAAGPEGPAGSAYVFLYDHVSFVRFLRVPNRWLMVSTFAVATLAGITVAEVRRAAPRHARRFVRRAPRRLVAFLVLGTLVCAARAFAPGLTTWEPPAAYRTAYAPLARDRSDWRILTTPFFQSWMEGDGRLTNGQAITADLGYTSSYWHHHAVLGRGGWDPRASRFAQYLYEVVKQGTTATLPKLLGAVDVRYVAIDPTRAIESVSAQNDFFRRQQGLMRVGSAGGITIFRNRDVVPQVFEAPTACVVAGGLGVLGDVSTRSDFEFSRLLLLFADQLVATGGRGELRRELAATRCLIVVPGGLDELRVLLGAVSTSEVAARAPAAWIRSQTSPTLDIGAEPATSVAVPAGASVAVRLRTGRAAWRRVWILGLRDRSQPDLAVSVDGRLLSRLSLRAPLGAGFRWQATAPVFLPAGRHRIVVRVTGAPASAAQLVRVAITSSRAATTIPGIVGMSVVRDAGAVGPSTPRGFRILQPLVSSPWHELGPPTHVRVTPTGSAGAVVRIRRSGRRYFTLAQADAARVDPSYAWALRFRGTGDGRTYYLNVVFDGARGESFGFRIRDTSRRERTILLSPLQPSFSSVSPTWSHVAGFTFSSSTKQRVPGTLVLAGPFATSIDLRPRFAGATAVLGGGWERGAQPVSVETRGLRDHVAVPGPIPNGYLVLTQSFNGGWRLQGSPVRHVVGLGFANAYVLNRTARRVTLRYAVASPARLATAASGTAWALVVGFLLLPSLRRRRP